jgi:hypothetical protein
MLLSARKHTIHHTWSDIASTAQEHNIEFQQIEELIQEQTEALYLLDESIITTNPSHDNPHSFLEHNEFPTNDHSVSSLFMEDVNLLEDSVITPTAPTRLMKHLFPGLGKNEAVKVDTRVVELAELRLELSKRDESMAQLSSKNKVCVYSYE